MSLARGAVGLSVTLPGNSHLLIFCLLFSKIILSADKGDLSSRTDLWTKVIQIWHLALSKNMRYMENVLCL